MTRKTARAQRIRVMQDSFSRLARLTNTLMRERVAGSSITVQQCYTLEALTDGSRTMKELAAHVGLHQSTVTRIVEKLERAGYISRDRNPRNLREVLVDLTHSGRQVHQRLDEQSSQVFSAVLDLLPEGQQQAVVQSLELIAGFLEPGHEALWATIRRYGCCDPGQGGDQ